MPGRARPQAIVVGHERRARLRELERAHEAPLVVRVDGLGCTRIECGEPRVRRSRIALDLGQDPLPHARAGRRRHVQVGERGAEVEPRAAADDRGPGACDELVDRCVRQRRVGADRHLLAQVPDPDERGRPGRLVGQDRQAAVHLHGVAGDDLGAEPVGDLLGHRGLPRRGRAEDGDHGDHRCGRQAGTAVATRAAQRRRRRSLDRHVDEVACLRRAGEHHGRVPARAAAQERLVGPALPLDEHLLDPPDALGVALGRDALHDLDEPLEPLVLDRLGHLVGHRRRVGAAAGRVDEREGAVVAHLLDDGERLLEVRLRLAGEADDDVGAERQVGNRVAQALARAAGSAPASTCGASP